MDEKTYYEIIGVRPDASPHQIRNSFMKLATKYQQDRRNFSAAGWYFDRLKAAYNVLSDYESRCQYNARLGLPEPPQPEERDAVSWLEGLAQVVPGSWYIFGSVLIGVIYLGARVFMNAVTSEPPPP